MADSYNRTVANNYQNKDIVETDYEVKAEPPKVIEPGPEQVDMAKLEAEAKGGTDNENV